MSSIRSPGQSATIVALRPSISPVTILVAGALAAAAGMAWAWLLLQPMHGSAMGRVAQPWSAAYLIAAAAMWAVMMTAMMAPSAAPMILLHSRVDRNLPAVARLGQTLVFMLSYLLVWTAFSTAAAALQAGAIALGIVSAATLALRIPYLGAALLLAAAAYELTLAKRQCLNQCQSPLLFLYRHYQPGVAGALRTGIIHGLYCLGCCWVLMLLLFVAGVMNLAWIALLGCVIVAEKQAPPQWGVHRWIAGLLATGALAILAW